MASSVFPSPHEFTISDLFLAASLSPSSSSFFRRARRRTATEKVSFAISCCYSSYSFFQLPFLTFSFIAYMNLGQPPKWPTSGEISGDHHRKNSGFSSFSSLGNSVSTFYFSLIGFLGFVLLVKLGFWLKVGFFWSFTTIIISVK